MDKKVHTIARQLEEMFQTLDELKRSMRIREHDKRSRHTTHKEGSSSSCKKANVPSTTTPKLRSRDMRCLVCLGWGHLDYQCPNGKEVRPSESCEEREHENEVTKEKEKEKEKEKQESEVQFERILEKDLNAKESETKEKVTKELEGKEIECMQNKEAKRVLLRQQPSMLDENGCLSNNAFPLLSCVETFPKTSFHKFLPWKRIAIIPSAPLLHNPQEESCFQKIQEDKVQIKEIVNIEHRKVCVNLQEVAYKNFIHSSTLLPTLRDTPYYFFLILPLGRFLAHMSNICEALIMLGMVRKRGQCAKQARLIFDPGGWIWIHLKIKSLNNCLFANLLSFLFLT